MGNNKYVITAAGGNATAIEVINSPLSREEYERRGINLMKEFGKFSVEQSGFIVLKDDHFEMSGGEFCGNAARAAALLFSNNSDKSKVEFTMSGFKGVIEATVNKSSKSNFSVTCLFPKFNIDVKKVKFKEDDVYVVDLGGIVHVVIDGYMPTEYELAHREIMNSLDLKDRDAVGVVWTEKVDDSINIKPVVWVNSINTFFYETSCGSGSIAVSKVFGKGDILQPSGRKIEVKFSENKDCLLTSKMEVVYGIN